MQHDESDHPVIVGRVVKSLAKNVVVHGDVSCCIRSYLPVVVRVTGWVGGGWGLTVQ
jgi:hypothetical protein